MATWRARLIRWAWSQYEAQAAAERQALRDPAGDDLASCTEYASYRPGRCGNHRRAGLFSPEVGCDLAAMPRLKRGTGRPALFATVPTRGASCG